MLMKIGILGGSFDPIHKGHLAMAERAQNEYGLDQVWLIPAGHSPNKDEKAMTPGAVRLEMAARAIGVPAVDEMMERKREASPEKKLWRGTIYPDFYVSTIELDDTEVSYTYRTLEKLTALYPEHQFYFIMGADSLNYFEKWVKPERIARLAKILVVNRDQFSEAELEDKLRQLFYDLGAEICIVHGTKLDVSSTDVRNRIKNGDFPEEMLSREVGSYIKIHHLYGSISSD